MGFDAHKAVMDELKRRLDAILLVAPPGSRIVYFDYPLYFNVGDQLIYLGTLEFFKTHNYIVEGYYSLHNCNVGTFPELSTETIVMFQGGGNFGDLYPKHQVFREQLVKKYSSNRVVVMPQTIFFEDVDSENRSAAVFQEHSDLIIYARDERSLSIAKKFSDKCYLMPDMAQYLWGTDFISEQSYSGEGCESLVLLQDRIDSENSGNRFEGGGKEVVAFDWYELLPAWIYRFRSVLSLLSTLTKNNRHASRVLNYLWKLTSQHCVSLSANKINAYDYFVTTRLHGHIFSQLISHPNTILDNSYGKVGAYADCWTMKSGIVKKWGG